MKMTATCGIQKFRWRERIKHLSKYWAVVNTGRPLQVKIWGVATPATPCGVDAYGHHNLTSAQSERLDALQKRAQPRIILHPLELPVALLHFVTSKRLKSRSHNFRIKFFKQICHPDSCLRNLLPPELDPNLSARLRHPTVSPVPHVRTTRDSVPSWILPRKTVSDLCWPLGHGVRRRHSSVRF